MSLDKFLSFIYDSDPGSAAELRRDLDALGANLPRVEQEVGLILAQARKALGEPAGVPAPLGLVATMPVIDEAASTPSSNVVWLERSRRKMELFEHQAKIKARAIAGRYKGRDELLQATLSGGLGTSVQVRAAVFFRNKNSSEISENDLRSFIEDCELLGLLQGQ